MSVERPQADPPPTPLHLPSLGVALGLMLAGTAYPWLLTGPGGRARHDLLLLLMWAMCAGFVRGVGFVPRWRVGRWLLSAPACAVALLLAGLLRAQGGT